MFESIGKGWRLFKETFAILSREKSLILYPVISGIIILLILGLLFIPLLFISGTTGINPENMGITGYVIWILVLFVIFLVVSFVSSFFKAGIVFNATEVIKGNDPAFKDGINAALSKTGSLFVWALIAATVGIVLSLLRESDNPLGRMVTEILVGIAGAVWNLVTFFVIPVMIFEDKAPFPSIKESWELFKKTWGETVIAGFSFGIVFIPAFLLMAASFLSVIVAPFEVFAGMIALTIIVFALTSVIVSALQGILVALLYHYAKTGEISSLVERELIEGAFVEKKTNKKTGEFIPGQI
ncbi:hypothetical protein F1737_11120 [Methanoplanus sp. FWC-SCC4]|uniref:Uncharacterized protein n=1 Tax=Methanochimaera problematica TaxID=2609417 RepID=A0AA97I3B9_9EURY|nr:DUF6159 family protein [Methanoplanus sp. FWC-SCC4]WOF17190.1 hypothetical protein F1737_11120 [Methanoplanus sp. FWC-SCC4]